MSAPLPDPALRVQEYLKAQGCAAVVVELPGGTRTAADAARAVGCDVAQIAKSIVFRATRTGRPVLVVASGAHRVDEAAIAGLLGEPVGKATPEFVREKTGYAIGGVPPVAHGTPPAVFVDEHLLALGTVWAAAGTPMTVFPVAPAELVRLTGGTVARVALQPGA
jgi:prolyl-tRNA editing enzyme YbaK/EbsC (Cys-tRNA(Pro) deacylase)